MEIIKINQTSVKVILTNEECEKYQFVSADEASDEKMQSSIDSLLDEINNRNGLDLKNNKLLLQVYPIKSGGCEIYISCTEEEEMYKEKIAAGSGRKNQNNLYIFKFDTVTELMSACGRLSSITDDKDSQIYYDSYKSKYYLVSSIVSSKEMRFAFISEYAKTVKPQLIHYIKEHLKCICESNALKTISSLL